VDALSALSPAQRSEYLQGQRSIEETRSSERLQQLTQVQSCLSRQSAPAAQKTCWKTYATALQKSRAQQAQQQQELAKRFGLPEPAKKKKKQ
jgi:ribosome-binding protein aMBF1 (putative translation factor)